MELFFSISIHIYLCLESDLRPVVREWRSLSALEVSEGEGLWEFDVLVVEHLCGVTLALRWLESSYLDDVNVVISNLVLSSHVIVETSDGVLDRSITIFLVHVVNSLE